MASKNRDKRADNALRSGLRIRADFCTARLPDGCGHVRKQANRLRRIVEAELIEQHGKLSAYLAALCQSMVRHEVRAQLASRWLWRAKDLTLDQQLALSKAVCDASDARDRCLKAAGLDSRSQASLWDAVYASPPLPATSPPVAGGSQDADRPADASDAAVGDDAAIDEEAA